MPQPSPFPSFTTSKDPMTSRPRSLAALRRLGDGTSRRGLLKGGVGLAGVAGLMLSGNRRLCRHAGGEGSGVTNYRLSPPGWPAGRRLTITVIADLHAGGPNMGVARIREVVETANFLEVRSDRAARRLFRHSSLRHRARAA